MSKITPLTCTLAFLAVALAVRAYTAGELPTLWLMTLAYAGGLVSGVLLAVEWCGRDG